MRREQGTVQKCDEPPLLGPARAGCAALCRAGPSDFDLNSKWMKDLRWLLDNIRIEGKILEPLPHSARGWDPKVGSRVKGQ